MNQDLAQILTNVDALVNSLRVDPLKAGNSQVEDIVRIRNEMESMLKSYNSTISKANEDVRKNLEAKAKEVQSKISYLLQPQP